MGIQVGGTKRQVEDADTVKGRCQGKGNKVILGLKVIELTGENLAMPV